MKRIYIAATVGAAIRWCILLQKRRSESSWILPEGPTRRCSRCMHLDSSSDTRSLNRCDITTSTGHWKTPQRKAHVAEWAPTHWKSTHRDHLEGPERTSSNPRNLGTLVRTLLSQNATREPRVSDRLASSTLSFLSNFFCTPQRAS